MVEIKDADSSTNFLANQGISRFGIVGLASSHLLIAGYWELNLELVRLHRGQACIFE